MAEKIYFPKAPTGPFMKLFIKIAFFMVLFMLVIVVYSLVSKTIDGVSEEAKKGMDNLKPNSLDDKRSIEVKKNISEVVDVMEEPSGADDISIKNISDKPLSDFVPSDDNSELKMSCVENNCIVDGNNYTLVEIDINKTLIQAERRYGPLFVLLPDSYDADDFDITVLLFNKNTTAPPIDP